MLEEIFQLFIGALGTVGSTRCGRYSALVPLGMDGRGLLSGAEVSDGPTEVYLPSTWRYGLDITRRYADLHTLVTARYFAFSNGALPVGEVTTATAAAAHEVPTEVMDWLVIEENRE